MRSRVALPAAALLAVLVLVAALLVVSGGQRPAHAQPPAAKPAGAKPRPKPGNMLDIKRLDTKLDEVRESFLRETTTLITSYENLGQYERAKVVLESLQKLDPRNEPIKAKLAQLNERILEMNEFEVEIEPGEQWQPIGIVRKDRPLRIRVVGDYKLSTELKVGPEGAPTANPAEDLVAGVPLGAVMGVILPEGTVGQFAAGGGGGGGGGDRPPRPFAVGAVFDKAADRDGVLYLKANLPPGAKCTGKLKVTASGPERPGQLSAKDSAALPLRPASPARSFSRKPTPCVLRPARSCTGSPPASQHGSACSWRRRRRLIPCRPCRTSTSAATPARGTRSPGCRTGFSGRASGRGRTTHPAATARSRWSTPA